MIDDEIVDFESIRPAITTTGGLILSQVVEFTGVAGSTIQNWVKRGWIPAPVEKKYGERHIARILILDMMRRSMQLENIIRLMECINGDVEDQSDDIIKDADLYIYIYKIVKEIGSIDKFSIEEIDRVISEQLENYRGPEDGYTGSVSNSKQRLSDCLRVVILTYISGEMAKRAESELKKMQ